MQIDETAQTVATGKGRIEAFSDGVIAVAITLLVLNLRVPDPSGPGGLAGGLAAMWPDLLAYVISFLAIGIMWISHHGMLRRLAAVDHSILVANIILLLCIVVLPFTTSLFATYLRSPGEAWLAAVIYAGMFMVTSAVFVAMQVLVVTRRPALLRAPLDAAERRSIVRRGAIAVPGYLLAAAAGFVTPYATLAICTALGLFYLVSARFAR